MKRWTTANIPIQQGRLAIVTGVSGLGYEDSLALAKVGATVIMAGRNAQKGNEAVQAIRNEYKDADVHFEQLDLADLASISAFSKRIAAKFEKLDILINNAGVMTPPTRLVTNDNFELQFGTNYLGHFALTAGLLPLLKKAKGRVVSLSSVAARNGTINFDDINSQTSYAPMKAYGQSKVACLLFAKELQRKSNANKWGITSIAAHPGIARTNLLHNGAGEKSLAGRARTFAWFVFQPPAQGALPTLFAATSPDAKPGAYYGPNGVAEVRGYPTLARVPKGAQNTTVGEKLWDLSEKLAKVKF